jgi:nucleoid DNA-binding protein
MITSKSLTKSNLVKEVALQVGLSRVAVGRVLEQLATIAYREAENGFVIPGLCKIKVVKRKPSRHRNPFTGKLLLIGERKAVKFVPL